jgi:hypothetical protein
LGREGDEAIAVPGKLIPGYDLEQVPCQIGDGDSCEGNVEADEEPNDRPQRGHGRRGRTDKKGSDQEGNDVQHVIKKRGV